MQARIKEYEKQLKQEQIQMLEIIENRIMMNIIVRLMILLNSDHFYNNFLEYGRMKKKESGK